MVAGSTTRQASSFSSSSRSSAKAKRENAGEARSSEDGGARVWRSSSITRSLPGVLDEFHLSVKRSVARNPAGVLPFRLAFRRRRTSPRHPGQPRPTTPFSAWRWLREFRKGRRKTDRRAYLRSALGLHFLSLSLFRVHAGVRIFLVQALGGLVFTAFHHIGEGNTSPPLPHSPASLPLCLSRIRISRRDRRFSNSSSVRSVGIDCFPEYEVIPACPNWAAGWPPVLASPWRGRVGPRCSLANSGAARWVLNRGRSSLTGRSRLSWNLDGGPEGKRRDAG